MSAHLNEAICGTYDHTGDSIIYNDTDSLVFSTVIQTNRGPIPIGELFESGTEFWNHGDKEYAGDDELMVMSYDQEVDQPYFGHINYIYRHKVSKDLYEVTDALGNTITVTEDHSVMVERDGELMEMKPQDIRPDDILISIVIDSADQPGREDQLKDALFDLIMSDTGDIEDIKSLLYGYQTTVISLSRNSPTVRKLGSADDQYVYDIGMRNEDAPWFFGNNILVHNSAYFTATPMLQRNPELQDSWNKDVAVQIYDGLAEDVNQSFPEFMERAFHCPRKNGEIIKASREIVATRGLFVKKKKYAVMVYDKEGKRYDTNGKTGKLKVTGFDMKRSDTPAYVQDYLEEVLIDVLNGESQESIVEKIKTFKLALRAMDPWTKGSPKGIKKLVKYAKALDLAANGKGSSKVNMPGHTRAALNWNYLRKMNGDNYSAAIVDGMKIVVCKLKDNPLGMTSVAYPKDELRLPLWFTELPFDVAAMEKVLLDDKLTNMIGVLGWDLQNSTNTTSTFGDLFSFD